MLKFAARTWLIAAILVAGCTGATTPTAMAPAPTATIAPAPSSTASAPGSTEATPVMDLPSAVLDPVMAEVQRLAGVPMAGIRIQIATPVTFPDGGLGCPVPGIEYPQVQVDGYRIVAEAGGQTYDYRGTAPGKFRRCLSPSG
jgi:uncharacterized protein YceK